MRSLVILALALIPLSASSVTADYRETEVRSPGTITGQVRIAGEVSALPPQAVFKQTEVCGTSLPDERLLVGKEGGLRNAVVYLTDINSGKPARLDLPVKLDNKKCAFVPHVVSATRGQTLEIHNSDPFMHDAHAMLGGRTLFNIGVMKHRTRRRPLLDTGVIHINCNVRHTWMHAYLLVIEHPYHAVTDRDGRFLLEGVPPGVWTVRVWHEMLGTLDRQVRLQPDGSTTVEIAFPVAAQPE